MEKHKNKRGPRERQENTTDKIVIRVCFYSVGKLILKRTVPLEAGSREFWFSVTAVAVSWFQRMIEKYTTKIGRNSANACQ